MQIAKKNHEQTQKITITSLTGIISSVRRCCFKKENKNYYYYFQEFYHLKIFLKFFGHFSSLQIINRLMSKYNFNYFNRIAEGT